MDHATNGALMLRLRTNWGVSGNMPHSGLPESAAWNQNSRVGRPGSLGDRTREFADEQVEDEVRPRFGQECVEVPHLSVKAVERPWRARCASRRMPILVWTNSALIHSVRLTATRRSETASPWLGCRLWVARPAVARVALLM